MWYPWDSTENRWVFEDGLVALLGYIITHLFREEWFRETGEWLGPEFTHLTAESISGEENQVRNE